MIVSERLDHTLGSLLATKEASGRWVSLATLRLVVWWVFVAIAITVVLALASIASNNVPQKAGLASAGGWSWAGVAGPRDGDWRGSVSVGGLPNWVLIPYVCPAVRHRRAGSGKPSASGMCLVEPARDLEERDARARASPRVGVFFSRAHLPDVVTAGQAARRFPDLNHPTGAGRLPLAAAVCCGEMIRESGLRILKAENAD